MEIALKNVKKTVTVSMSQEIHLPDKPLLDIHAGHDTDFSQNFDDGHNTNAHVDDDDDILIESTTVETDCIDFGSRALHHEYIRPELDHYNAYDMIMSRAKELVSLVDASKFPRERGVLVEEALDKIISTEKANIASEKPQPRGTVVSGCPVGKVRKTCVSSWNF